MYNVKSNHADEFIDDSEILETLAYAEKNKSNRALIEEIIDKAAKCKGLTHREAAVLLDCDQPDLIARYEQLAREVKQRFYGNRIVMFAPLYLSNYCINGCVYCPYHAKNKTIPRKKLSQDEIRAEVEALVKMGHKRIALEAGEHPVMNPLEYILESIHTIYDTKVGNGEIRRLNVNIAATEVEAYEKLKAAGIGTYILFQETYNRKNYESLHPTGPKSNYCYHTEAMDRAQLGGCDDVGIGVLYGLTTYRYDFVGLLMHAEHLEARFGVGPHTISVPRICPAEDISLDEFPDVLPDDIFCRIIAVIRLAVPYTGMIISTRESQSVRAKVLDLGVSQISGGINWLLSIGYLPSFCTACYRSGRTGDRFMELCKAGKIGDICTPNALMTLKEYLMDFASQDTIAKGDALIQRELAKISNDRVREIATQHIQDIAAGQRDFYF